MKFVFTVVALSIAAAFTAPAFAQKAEPKTQAECQKVKGMKWDPGSKRCLPK